jgi:hypothetical protein
MAFYNKLKWILGILMIFVLIIATNLIDKNNFVRVRDSVQTIYEDRIVANDLIFNMQKAVHQKELATLLADTSFFKNENTKVNHDLKSLISRFKQTKLTPEEESVFSDLKKNLELLLDYESQLTNFESLKDSKAIGYINDLKLNLEDLSEIQLTEGSRQMSISNSALKTVELYTQIEIYILVFLAILIQIIVMYKPKEKS